MHNIVNIYSGINLLQSGGESIAIITHGRFFSKFDIINWTWVNHVEFEDDIIKLFRCDAANGSCYQNILLANGAIYTKLLAYEDFKNKVDISNRTAKVDERIIRVTEDLENYNAFYLVVKDNEGLYKLKCLYREKVIDIPIVKPQANLSITSLQVRSDDTKLAVLNGNKLTLCSQSQQGGGIKLRQIYSLETDAITGTLHSGTAYDTDKHAFLFDNKNMYLIKMNPDSVTTFPNIYCIGLQNFTRSCNYCICQETSDSLTPGLRIFDMESVAKTSKPCMNLLKSIDIGALG